MNAEIIAVGSELLQGQSHESNSHYIARQIDRYGLAHGLTTVVDDHPHRIWAACHAALKRAEFVFLTGGLGPTSDDITKEILFKKLRVPLCFHSSSYQHIVRSFQKRCMAVPHSNRKQAMLPKNATILKNRFGTAPGLFYTIRSKDAFGSMFAGKHLILLPGPPSEMSCVFDECRKQVRFFKNKRATKRQMYCAMTIGLPESEIADRLSDLLDQMQGLHFAILASPHGIKVRLSASSSHTQQWKNIVRELRKRLRPYIYSESESKTLPIIVKELLSRRREKISFAESCTGGWASSLFVGIPGSSDCLEGSCVTYSDRCKSHFLKIPSARIRRYGAVSAEIAMAMAQSIQKRCQSHVGVGITGIAGPSGGTAKKPVGTVYIAVVYKKACDVQRFIFHGSRNTIRLCAAIRAYDMVRRQLIIKDKS